MNEATPRTYYLVSLRHPIAVQTAPRVLTRTSTLLVVWGKDYSVSGQEVTVHAVVTELSGELVQLDKPTRVLLLSGTIAATQLFRGPPTAAQPHPETRHE